MGKRKHGGLFGMDSETTGKVDKITKKIRKAKDPDTQRRLEGRLFQLLQHAAQRQEQEDPSPQQQPHFEPPPRQHQQQKQQQASVGVASTAEEVARRKLRAQRFPSDVENGEEREDQDLQAGGGLGRCEALEKEYRRLTSAPRASEVRPPHILECSLKLAKARWIQNPDYSAACEQLKSIRQDLTVQHVRDSFTVSAYETHARIALEVGDLPEFNSCHSVLRGLYEEGVPGNVGEFAAYGLLYACVACGLPSVGGATPRHTLVTELASLARQQQQQQQQPQDQQMVQQQTMQQQARQQQTKQKQRKQKPGSQKVAPLLRHPNVQHALAVVQAFRACNWQHFVRLYGGAPAMSPYLMDRLLPSLRRQALQAMLVGYQPTQILLSHLAQALGFEAEDDVAAFAASEGAAVNDMVLETRVRKEVEMNKEDSILQSKQQPLPRPQQQQQQLQQQQQHMQADQFAQGTKKGKKRKKGTASTA